jgi:hypothetical protein
LDATTFAGADKCALRQPAVARAHVSAQRAQRRAAWVQIFGASTRWAPTLRTAAAAASRAPPVKCASLARARSSARGPKSCAAGDAWTDKPTVKTAVHAARSARTVQRVRAVCVVVRPAAARAAPTWPAFRSTPVRTAASAATCAWTARCAPAVIACARAVKWTAAAIASIFRMTKPTAAHATMIATRASPAPEAYADAHPVKPAAGDRHQPASHSTPLPTAVNAATSATPVRCAMAPRAYPYACHPRPSAAKRA